MAMSGLSVDEQNTVMEFLAQVNDEEAEAFVNMIIDEIIQEKAGALCLIKWEQFLDYLLNLLRNIQFAVIVFAIGPADPGGSINPRAHWVQFQELVNSKMDYVLKVGAHAREIARSVAIEDKEPFKIFFKEAYNIAANIVKMLQAKADFAQLVKRKCDENRQALWVAHLPPEIRNAGSEIQQAFKERPWEMYMMPGTVMNPQSANVNEAVQVVPPGGIDILRDWEDEICALRSEHAATGNNPSSIGQIINLHQPGTSQTLIPQDRLSYGQHVETTVQLEPASRISFPTYRPERFGIYDESLSGKARIMARFVTSHVEQGPNNATGDVHTLIFRSKQATSTKE